MAGETVGETEVVPVETVESRWAGVEGLEPLPPPPASGSNVALLPWREEGLVAPNSSPPTTEAPAAFANVLAAPPPAEQRRGAMFDKSDGIVSCEAVIGHNSGA